MDNALEIRVGFILMDADNVRMKVTQADIEGNKIHVAYEPVDGGEQITGTLDDTDYVEIVERGPGVDPKKPTVETLTTAFKAAIVAATQAHQCADGGTCNFDSAFLWISHRYAKRVEEAAKTAGVHVRAAKWLGSGYFVGSPGHGGQGSRGTAVAEAITKALLDAGLEAGTYYQRD